MSRRPERKRLSLRGAHGRLDGPTPERRRNAARQGGITRLEATDGGLCHGVRHPLAIDYLLDMGGLSDEAHATALWARELFERTSFRGRLTAAYRDRVGRTTNDPDQEDADDRYRGVETRILRQAGRPAWSAFRRVVVEDRRPASAMELAQLAAALRIAARIR